MIRVPSNTCFGASLHTAGCQHECVSIPRGDEQVDLFNAVDPELATRNARKEPRGLGKNEVERTRKIAINEKNPLGSGRSMHGYMLF